VLFSSTFRSSKISHTNILTAIRQTDEHEHVRVIVSAL
jgi:hypothetical protein